MRGATLLLAALLALLPACAPRLEPLTPESLAAAQDLAREMNARRAGHDAAAALVQAELKSRGPVRLWPGFTALFRYRAPDAYALNGYSDIGLPLFAYQAEGGVYTVTTPDGPADGGPAAEVLHDLTHLLDGALGVDLGGGPPRRTRDGRWFVARDGASIRFTVADGHVTALSVERAGRKPTRIRFDDFRGAGWPLPYRMDVELAEYRVKIALTVLEWNLVAAAPPDGAGNGP